MSHRKTTFFVILVAAAAGCANSGDGNGDEPPARVSFSFQGSLMPGACASAPAPTCVGPARNVTYGDPDQRVGNATVTLAWTPQPTGARELELGLYRLTRPCDERNCTDDDLELVSRTQGPAPRLTVNGHVNGTFAIVVTSPTTFPGFFQQDFDIDASLVILEVGAPVPPSLCKDLTTLPPCPEPCSDPTKNPPCEEDKRSFLPGLFLVVGLVGAGVVAIRWRRAPKSPK